MLKSVKSFASMRVPYFSTQSQLAGVVLGYRLAYAEKSAEPVTARLESLDRRACHTAPLCPRNVPIL